MQTLKLQTKKNGFTLLIVTPTVSAHKTSHTQITLSKSAINLIQLIPVNQQIMNNQRYFFYCSTVVSVGLTEFTLQKIKK